MVALMLTTSSPLCLWRQRRRRRLSLSPVFLWVLLLLCPQPQQQRQASSRNTHATTVVLVVTATEIVATHEWQSIGINDTLPAGLEIRIDMTTGEKWARLLPPDDEAEHQHQEEAATTTGGQQPPTKKKVVRCGPSCKERQRVWADKHNLGLRGSSQKHRQQHEEEEITTDIDLQHTGMVASLSWWWSSESVIAWAVILALAAAVILLMLSARVQGTVRRLLWKTGIRDSSEEKNS